MIDLSHMGHLEPQLESHRLACDAVHSEHQ